MFCVTPLSPYKSGLGLLATPAGSPLDVRKGPGSIAPLGAELWPFKEGNHKKKIHAKVQHFANPFLNMLISVSQA